MHYLLANLKESNGFVAARVWEKTLLLCHWVYGLAIHRDGQILHPNSFFMDSNTTYRWKEKT